MHDDYHRATTLRRLARFEKPPLHVVFVRLPRQALRGPRRRQRGIRARPLDPTRSVVQRPGEDLRSTVERITDGGSSAVASDGELEEVWLESDVLVLTPQCLHAAIVHRSYDRSASGRGPFG